MQEGPPQLYLCTLKCVRVTHLWTYSLCKLLTSLLFIAFFCDVVFIKRGGFSREKVIFVFSDRLACQVHASELLCIFSKSGLSHIRLHFIWIHNWFCCYNRRAVSYRIHYIFLPVMNSLYFACIHLLNLYTESLQPQADVVPQSDSWTVNHTTFHSLPPLRYTIYH